MSESLFSGLKVVDCASFIAAPAAAVSLYASIVTALYQRERIGKGDYGSSSLLANGIWTNLYLAQAA